MYEAECSPEHFDTFFVTIGQKMRWYPKNWIGGGLKITIYVIILVLYPFLTSVEVDVFQVKESIL